MTVGTQNLDTREGVVTWGNGSFRIERSYDPSVRVHDFVLKCVGFVGEIVHRDSLGAHGEPYATGFFVSVPAQSPRLAAGGASVVYFVTAKHVAHDLKDSEICFIVNKRSGGTMVIESAGVIGKPWWFHPTDPTADVVIAQVREQPTADIVSVDVSQLATPEILERLDIGIGDEVYTTGLFKPAAGPDSNLPILRQGNIAMLPKEQIQTELGYADVYLMEVRSLGGLSGSPVFVRPSIDFKVADGRGKQRDAFAAGLGFVLLGLMHGHWDIKESEINKANFEPDRKRGVNMGIGIVVPATKILETINQPELVAMRKEAEERATRRMVPGMDSAKREDHDTQITKTGFEVPVPSSKQFFDGLKKASRKVQAPKT